MPESLSYNRVQTGEIAGATGTATVLPTVACKLVCFKANADNAGKFYLGVSGATTKQGTNNATTGYQLAAGEQTPWIPVDNLNRFFRVSDNAGDGVTYIALG
jgi:hypothetical protein